MSLFHNGTPDLGERSISEITFRGKLSEPIHRWYRLTASFSPQLATDILSHFDLPSNARVIDPFCGVGTVPLCAQRVGVSATGVEINPMLARVASTKLSVDYDLANVRTNVQAYIEGLQQDISACRGKRINDLDDIEWPPIYNAERWWQEAPMKILLLAEKRRKATQQGYTAELIGTGLAGVLVELSDAGAGRVSLSFLDSPPEISEDQAFSAIRRQLNEMLSDLESWDPVRRDLPAECRYEIRNADSRRLKRICGEAEFHVLLTSPPYPNRFSYVRETRPHLYFFHIMEDRSAAGELDLQTIGGTWGKATSTLDDDLFQAREPVKDALGSVLPELAGENLKMANYIIRYFNAMWDHIQSLPTVMAEHSRVIYVVGNTKISGFELRTDDILAELLGHVGFKTDSIERMRKRQSRKGLYEATVFASRG